MLDDQTFTERQHVTKQPGTCMHCHGSVYLPYKKLGGGDLIKGFETMNQMPYTEARKLVSHPVACIDCHDPQTMQLRVTRPGFIEGIRVVKASQGIANYDVNTMATRSGDAGVRLRPVPRGVLLQGPREAADLSVGQGPEGRRDPRPTTRATASRTGRTPRPGAPALKAQHPEFEMWNQGIHARSGVTCTDCHMPYQREGALKISDHHVRSPLLNINRACQTCHKWSEDELRDRVISIQDRTYQVRNVAMDALVALIGDIKAAKAAGQTDEQLATARDEQRQAQFLLDFIEAENSMGFHAPQESMRVLATSIEHTRRGQMALRSR